MATAGDQSRRGGETTSSSLSFLDVFVAQLSDNYANFTLHVFFLASFYIRLPAGLCARQPVTVMIACVCNFVTMFVCDDIYLLATLREAVKRLKLSK